MLHEALFLLWNSPGGLFQYDKVEDWVEQVELWEFLHYNERQLLCKITSIALQYHELEEFLRRVTNLHTICYDVPVEEETSDKAVVVLNSDIRRGIYLRAFCNGLDEVLGDYRNEITRLEKEILKNPHLTLVDVLASIGKYVTLLSALKSIIRTIKIEQIHGCLLVGRLHMYVDCGVETIVEAKKTIIKSVNRMFYRHLCNWIIYGDLVDVYNEFFISDAKCADENFLYPEQLAENNASNASTAFQLLKKSRLKRPTEVRKFLIVERMLPLIIPLDVAETILFMGRIVWIVRNDPKKSLDDDNAKYKRDIWDGKDVEYYQKIQALENKPLELNEFIKTIEMCRLKLTKYLWKVMVDEAKLLEHLQLIRDYYALGRGELFQQFIIAAEDQFKESPPEHIVTNLNFIFNETARKMYSENDKTYKRFELSVIKHEDKKKLMKPLTQLEINFDILWPLHIVFHPKAMSLYNKLFCFLLRVKKTHIDLHKLWLIHMEGKEKIDRDVWTLRHNLMFLVNNLQYYLQVDVIEAQFALLKEAVKNASEFEDIIRLHSKFLSNLLSQTFVMSGRHNSKHKQRHDLYQLPDLNYEDKNMIYKVILLLLELCDEFCLRASSWGTELLDPQRIDLERYKKRADDIVQTLLKMLFSLHEQVSGHHLLQLLHRLDFNRWYSRTDRKSVV